MYVTCACFCGLGLACSLGLLVHYSAFLKRAHCCLCICLCYFFCFVFTGVILSELENLLYLYVLLVKDLNALNLLVHILINSTGKDTLPVVCDSFLSLKYISFDASLIICLCSNRSKNYPHI